MFEITSKLLNEGICMTDLTTRSSIYDGEKQRVMFTDFSGIVKKPRREDLERVNVEEGYLDYTKAYAAPELIGSFEIDNFEAIVNLCKCNSFSLGKIISKFATKNGPSLRELLNKLLSDNPIERISVEEGLEILKNIDPEEI